jgi:hypothetical protein
MKAYGLKQKYFVFESVIMVELAMCLQKMCVGLSGLITFWVYQIIILIGINIHLSTSI